MQPSQLQPPATDPALVKTPAPVLQMRASAVESGHEQPQSHVTQPVQKEELQSCGAPTPTAQSTPVLHTMQPALQPKPTARASAAAAHVCAGPAPHEHMEQGAFPTQASEPGYD